MITKRFLFQNIIILLLFLSSSCSKDSATEEISKDSKDVLQILNPIDPEIGIKTGDREITSENLKRDYILRVPSTYEETSKTPLVIALHGYSSKPMYIESNSKLTQLGEKEGFITVYPSGTLDNIGNRFWTIYGRLNEGEKNYDDIVFLQDLIESLKTELNIDEKRIYLTGNSNGGFMTYRAAFALSNTFAAVAVHAGLFPNTDFLPETEKPQGTIPLMHIHGLKDDVVLSDEIPEGSFFRDAQGSVDYWIANNGADTTSTILRDDANVNIQEWESEANNADVVYLKAKNGTHEWFNTSNSGKIDSSLEIWNFFKQYSR